MIEKRLVRVGLALLAAAAIALQSCAPAQPPLSPTATQSPPTSEAATAAPASTATIPAATSTTVVLTPTASAPAPTAAPTERVAQTACDHAYFPLRMGATWNYTSTNGAGTWDVVAVTGDTISATAGIQLGPGARAATIQWHCTADGLVAYDAADYLANDKQHTTGVSITDTMGVSLLPADKLSVGVTWDMAFTVTYTVLNGAQKLPYRNQYWNHYTLAATEPLLVGDQTYDALRVDEVTTSTVTGGGIPERTFHTATKWWYARDIGLVGYQTMSLGGQTALYKLVSKR